MKKLLALLLCAVMLLAFAPATLAEPDAEPTANLEINEANFPDEHFRAWVQDNLAGGKTYMTPTEVNAVTAIYCDGEHIASLKGIGKFPNLEDLDCSSNKLISLDLSGNKKLIEVECEHNQLTSLNVTKCTLLEELQCWDNSLSSLDLTANTNLLYLDAENNNFKSINLSKNTKLVYLYLSGNQLTSLDVTKMTDLEGLAVENNDLSKLNLSGNAKLMNLYAKNNVIESIDVSKNPALTFLDVFGNHLTSIDVTKNPELYWLDVGENMGIKKIDVTKNPRLAVLHAENTVISELDLSKNPDLVTLNVCETSLKGIDVTKNTKLARLYAWACLLGSIDVSKNTKLVELDVAENLLTDLDVTKNTLLERLDCSNNRITYVNLNNNTKLVRLNVSGNRMEFLNLRYCTNLESLECGFNCLRQLHLENNTKLSVTNDDISPQRSSDGLVYYMNGGYYYYNMGNLFESDSETAYVLPYNSSYSYDASTGRMRMPGNVSQLNYKFNTGKAIMDVEIYRYYSGDFRIELEEWGGLAMKGTTPYMIWNGAKRCPPFEVYDAGTGKYVDPWYYDFHFEENVAPGTGYLYVKMRGNAEEKRVWFKIYLPPTTATSVANVSDGIKISWAAVPGAAGYVVYRRAMNLSMTSWSKFDRWNNTTGTTFTDTKVYAGTRYQYGVKAYFANRTDPVSGASIGGVFDNYNLGEVGPLKTTVRIKTNKLNSVTAGTGKLTAKYTKIDVCTGYIVQVATNSAFTSGVKEAKVTSASTVSKTVSGLSSGKTYYVRVRGYNEFNGTTYYGEWSNVLNCKVK